MKIVFVMAFNDSQSGLLYTIASKWRWNKAYNSTLRCGTQEHTIAVTVISTLAAYSQYGLRDGGS